ncbi:hypothetical protein HZA99_04195 [Candidatus Woesearchaeota archaeon]|nr:hypothetical protein [Candidatus Woesearchaeota archaeon]
MIRKKKEEVYVGCGFYYLSKGSGIPLFSTYSRVFPFGNPSPVTICQYYLLRC